MKRPDHGDIDRLRELLTHPRPARAETGRAHPPPDAGPEERSRGSTSPAARSPDDAPPAARLRALPDPPDEEVRERGVFGHRRVDPGLPGARVLIVLGLVAALVAGGYLWTARPRPQAVPEPAGRPSLQPPAAPAATSQGAAVVVHVHGKVRRPGVVSLPGGARVADAIKAAGGARPGAGTGDLNLARKVIDGEQIAVGVRATAPAPAGSPAPVPSGPGGGGAPLDLNTATAEQLDGLPGVGPVLAQRIVDHRTRHGGFRSVEQLQEVSGIGARRFADLRAMVRV
ncbi:hypothetical protein GCM10023085_34550 [Actinomadura viridis]|uniref:Competence protein ComEA n=1 Tax=Actinomadura viridis TaxID=58110 RepID=A0A931DJA6_9ACTN|nr:ComEA family DNA-binding protein [Actinomadura viridis]MBG6088005.1 competence protein ComEA [Actinomadura viridis]